MNFKVLLALMAWLENQAASFAKAAEKKNEKSAAKIAAMQEKVDTLAKEAEKAKKIRQNIKSMCGDED
ncbi:hypothetical protein HYP06_gp060 [Vibrio phage vB_VspP_pVa5]|uniref:Uncharacterized protein n=1 Tax=Vibrio phage vB_VspP_pVa5 TaxID=1913109 RepID=A0A1J0GVA7_9CAUD|nr:hypothetical protein HYP06_gp060 [Vibrio phage vB_VspP_pVa5]APC46112.1 hypothetical protein vBVspPpVa5_0060 [Vibrio phage vB_VspP_pVa5]